MTDTDGQKCDAAHAAVERFVRSRVAIGPGTITAFVVNQAARVVMRRGGL